MAREIERKFLVNETGYKQQFQRCTRIVQGYLCSVPERSVRIRIRDSKGYITIKGAVNETGVSRYEWEKEIPLEEAEELFTLCEQGAIEKYRYEVSFGGHLFEVDEFLGDNLGLVVAEIELEDENEPFGKPDWLGREVTGDRRYYNSQLMRNPYSGWSRE